MNTKKNRPRMIPTGVLREKVLWTSCSVYLGALISYLICSIRVV
jgi:hypothetical protein